MVVHIACLNCLRAALLCSLRFMDNLIVKCFAVSHKENKRPKITNFFLKKSPCMTEKKKTVKRANQTNDY